jgi:hypothetical protein
MKRLAANRTSLDRRGAVRHPRCDMSERGPRRARKLRQKEGEKAELDMEGHLASAVATVALRVLRVDTDWVGIVGVSKREKWFKR